MIAPVSEPKARRHRAPGPLASARRAVAAVLLERIDQTKPKVPRLANYLAWVLVAWAVAIAFSYLAFGLWWTIRLD